MEVLRDRMERDLRLRRFAENTNDNYLGCVARFEAWHGHSADELGRTEVLAFLTWLVRERGVSASTQGGYLAALCFLYRVTLERPEVVAGIPWPRSGARLPAVLSRSEIETIFGATPPLKHRAAFLAGYAAGLRVSEVVQLQIGDIDSDRGVLHVRAGKGNRDREALLPPVLLSELRSYRLKGGSQGPYLFPNRNRKGQPMGRGGPDRCVPASRRQGRYPPPAGLLQVPACGLRHPHAGGWHGAAGDPAAHGTQQHANHCTIPAGHQPDAPGCPQSRRSAQASHAGDQQVSSRERRIRTTSCTCT
jgi:integrase